MITDKLLETLTQFGILSDWVSAEVFCKVTGQKQSNLHNKRKLWTQGLVWVKLPSHEIQYSIAGYNKWVTQQAQTKHPEAFKFAMEKCGLTSNGKDKDITLRSPLKPTHREYNKLAELEVS